MIPALLLQLDPLMLPIGLPGTVDVRLGGIIHCPSGSPATMDEIARSANGLRFVAIGETHDNADAHRWQAAIIEHLAREGRDIVTGLEMYTRPKQIWLDRYALGKLNESDFIEKSEWAKEWGFDFTLYKPVFDATLRAKGRLVALNVPREWVRAVGRGGPDALPSEAKGQVPNLFLENKDHRMIFDALMGGHPGMSPNVYAAQVLWDEAMSDSALKYLSQRYKSPKTVFIIIAGNGHVMYSQGIQYRILRQSGEKSLTIVTVEVPKGQKQVRVSRGIADYVIGVPAVARGNSDTIASLQ